MRTVENKTYPELAPARATAKNSDCNSKPSACTSEPARAKSSLKSPIRVLLVDDHPVIRMGLRACLSECPQICIVGEATDGHEALRKANELTPDVVLMDINMPRMNGLTAAAALRREKPGIKVLILSTHSDSDNVARLLQSGARGFTLKQAPLDELVQAIETVHRGEVFFSPDIARVALNQFVRGPAEGPQLGVVSNREREVLVGVAEGLSNKEIACRLAVGVRTVETHRERIMRKLDIHTIAGLTRFAIQKQLLPLPSLEPGL